MNALPDYELDGFKKIIQNQVQNIPEPTGPEWETFKNNQNQERETQAESVEKPTENEDILTDPEAEKANVLRDPEGLSFDQRIHEMKDGKPREWYGKLKRKKGWQKFIDQVREEQKPAPPPPPKAPFIEPPIQGPENQTDQMPEDPEAPVLLPEHLKDMSDRQLAELITNFYIGIGISKFGDEWMPINAPNGKTDRDSIVDSWELFLSEKRVGQNIPSWLRPWLEMASYAATRAVTKPRTNAYFFGFLDKIKQRFTLMMAYIKGKFSRKTKMEVPKSA